MLGVLVCLLFVTLVAAAAVTARIPTKAAPGALPSPLPRSLVRFERPLDLGLLLVHMDGERAGVASVHQADDLERTLGLFTRSVRTALADAAKHGNVIVTDWGVSIVAGSSPSPRMRTNAELAAHRLRTAIDDARADLVPPRDTGPILDAFRNVARRYGGQLELCPLAVTFVASGGPVLLAAERAGARVFEVRATMRFASPGSGRELSERVRRFLVGRRGAQLESYDGTVTLRLGTEPEPAAVVGTVRRLLRFGRLLSEPALSHATPYRDSRAALRARSAG